jgi:RNA polymerase sigma-70 factor (ECF subfamily)
MTYSQAIQIGFSGAVTGGRTVVRGARRRSTLGAMAEPAPQADAELLAEEARLARAAAGGDGDAFATLYERYARRAYNLAQRLSGSEDDAADAVQEAFLSVMRRLPEIEAERELAFGSYLFTATRNATYDLMRRQQRARPSDSIPESAVPLGSGAGGLGLDPGDPDEDPDRKVLLAAQREEIQAANARLPERQREALALRELEDLSYDEIAEVMEMNRNSVAQLISRARVNLREELRGGALASIAASSAECERALPLIAMRDDGQLDPDSEDAAWLAAHVAGCESCALATEAMQEAGASYRLWIPVAIAPWVFKETMAKAAELTGSDWSEVTERRLKAPTDPAKLPGLPPAYRGGGNEKRGSRRRAALVAALAILLLFGGVLAFAGGDDSDPPAVIPTTEEQVVQPAPQPAPEPRPVKKDKPKRTPETAPEAEPVVEALAPEPAPPSAGTESEAKPEPKPTGGGTIDPPKSLTDPKPEPEPEPEPTPEPPPPEPPREETPNGPVPGGPPTGP